jgi:hypothetical protein
LLAANRWAFAQAFWHSKTKNNGYLKKFVAKIEIERLIVLTLVDKYLSNFVSCKSVGFCPSILAFQKITDIKKKFVAKIEIERLIVLNWLISIGFRKKSWLIILSNNMG